MDNFLRRSRLYREWEARILTHAASKIDADNILLLEAIKTIDMWQRLALEEKRCTRDLAIALRASLEFPDVDIREDVDELIRELNDRIAQMEEQIVQ